MNGMRKWLCLLVGVALAAFALPSTAGKLFSFSIDASSSLVWSDSSLNTGGNSVINSVNVNVPAGVTFTITGWTGSSTKGSLYNSPTAPTSSTPKLSLPYTVTGPATLWLSGIVGTNPGQAFQVFTTGMTSGCSGTLVLAASAWTGNTWGGTQFTAAAPNADKAAIPCSGNLGCGSSTPGYSNEVGNPNLDPLAGTGTPDWVLTRDSDPLICHTPMPFSFSFNPFGNTANFTAPSAPSEHVWAEYTILWASQPVDQTTGFAPNVSILVTYGVPNPQIGTDDYFPAVACVDNDFNAPFATIPAGAPPRDPVKYPQYQPGQPALVCVAAQGWTSVGKDSNGNVLVQYYSTFIDKVDTGIIKN